MYNAEARVAMERATCMHGGTVAGTKQFRQACGFQRSPITPTQWASVNGLPLCIVSHQTLCHGWCKWQKGVALAPASAQRDYCSNDELRGQRRQARKQRRSLNAHL
mmetsp:Transcript_4570/g.12130  ORF Transcript_4570/g.12130 Transcript_4570/m.12130 type:complete len:106 (+) Transcript_4570:387-704(+)